MKLTLSQDANVSAFTSVKSGGVDLKKHVSTDLFQIRSLYANNIGYVSAVNGVPILKDIIFNMSFFQSFDIGMINAVLPSTSP